jgi:nifR3 family TIM-barrel protein
MSFWRNLEKPILILAPMEDVTDTVFRRVVISCGKPSVLFTEFTSCEGICSVGQTKVIHRLRYTQEERPLVAQIWGITPKDYFNTAKLILEMGFDGIDINMGCPVKKIIKQGACSALIKNPNLAKEIFLATKEGCQNKIPVSIKTRIGFDKIQIEDWCGFLLKELNPEVLTIHGRTVKEESKSPNHWDEIAKVVNLKNQIQKNQKIKTLIIGNGDIISYQQAMDKLEILALDGVMIGRGVFKDLWIFNQKMQNYKPKIEERTNLLREHIQLWVSEWSVESDNQFEPTYKKNYAILKKYFKVYINDFPEAADLRNNLMQTKNHYETLQFLEKWSSNQV